MSNLLAVDQEAQRIILEKITLGARCSMSKELGYELQGESRVELCQFIGSELAFVMSQRLLGKTLDPIIITYPADWWQAFKKRWLEWIPGVKARMAVHEIRPDVVFPKMPVPEKYLPQINAWDVWQYDASRSVQ